MWEACTAVARSIWKGVITFGMVSIPVRLFAATEDKDVSFHLLHQPDHSRVKFKRFCAAEDQEVPNEELVKAYEISKDQYVEITDEDLEKLPLPSRHTIELSSFVDAEEIDPIYYEKSYYLEPEETGVKPFALLMKVLDKKGVTGVATIALRNKESLCALRPLDGTLLLETLHYPDEIRAREQIVTDVAVNDKELAVASTLVEALQTEFDPSQYHDRYREALLELIESKAQGREVVEPEAPEAPQVTDLMAALRASIEAAQERKAANSGGTGARAASKQPAAPTTREEHAASRAGASRKASAGKGASGKGTSGKNTSDKAAARRKTKAA